MGCVGRKNNALIVSMHVEKNIWVNKEEKNIPVYEFGK